MRSMAAGAILILIFLSTNAVLSASELNSLDLIESAYESGRISAGERIIYRLMTVRDRENLPEQFRSDIPLYGKCATDIFFDAAQNYEQLTPEQQRAAKDYMSRPSRMFSYDSPDGHYKIHYDTLGTHAVPLDDSNINGIPDFVEWLADYADSSWKCIHEYLGYDLPPVDGGAGGDDKYDIYTENMAYYGYCISEGSGYVMPSYVSVNCNFYGFPENDDPDGDQKGAAKVTVAHEYFHAVQYGYNSLSYVWYKEVSSTWMEEICYPQTNDNYNYFPYFFPVPHFSLNSTTNKHEYGAFVWNRFIDQYFDTVAVREVWEWMRDTEGTNPYDAHEYVLTNRGSSLIAAYLAFCEWNFFTDIRDDGNHYEDADEYSQIDIMRTHLSNWYPVENQTPPAVKRPNSLGCNYILFHVPDDLGNMAIYFDGADSYNWVAQIIRKHRGQNLYDVFSMDLDSASAGSLYVYDSQLYEYIVLNPVVCQTSGTSLDYTYSAYLRSPVLEVEVVAGSDTQMYSAAVTSVDFTVHNTGQVADVFESSASDGLGWPLNVSPDQVFIDRDDSAVVTVTITCPQGTLDSIVNEIVLTSASQSNVNVWDEDTLSVDVFLQRGDADNSGNIDIDDVVYIISYIFSGGPAPQPELITGDADDTICSEPFNVDIDDVVFLIDYIFGGGPTPPCNPF